MKSTDAKEKTVLLISAAALLLLAVCSLCVGSYPISIADLRQLLAGRGNAMTAAVLFRLRLPRMLCGVCAGAVLGVTGAVYQTIFDNPLASPDLTGVASGASVGAAAAILLGIGSGFMRIGFAFIGGVAALGFVLLLVFLAGGERRSSYILAGVLISAAADAILMFLKITADPERELAAIEFWTMGSFSAITWEKAGAMLGLSLPALLFLLVFSIQTLILSRGSDAARSVGVSPALWRTVLLLLCTLAVAAVVSVVGVIGFAGLIVPHLTMCLYRRRSRGYFFVCGIIGSCLILLSDILARTVSAGSELPISIFCVLFAVIFLTVLLCGRHQRGGDGLC